MSTESTFASFSLSQPVVTAIAELGYEEPTPVQRQSIPVMLSGQDLLAQAQTGTGKTAAFALPILSQVDVSLKKTQALVIAPTRELAIQVAEAFQSYAKHIKDFHAVSIYGGQDYTVQLRALKRGPQVIVGTPGRLMDHMRRKSLSVADVKTLVLDEADEMLKMGFKEDIEWILEQMQHEHQTGLFSATMPATIQKIANRYLKNPEKIQIKSKTNTIATIEQCYTVVSRNQKLALLTRFLETETVSAAIVFARTKNESSELAEKLQTRGYTAAALNGDMNQALRKKTIDRMKDGSLDILVATDVAARGIDIERISHVFNYDMPYDSETYIHRIGRTGRAGRSGKSWVFVTPRERFLLRDIERAVNQPVKEVFPPSLNDLREIRLEKRVGDIALIIEKAAHKLERQDALLEAIMDKTGVDARTVAAALAHYIHREDSASQEDVKIEKVSLEEGGNRGRRNDRGRRGDRSRSRGDRPSGPRSGARSGDRSGSRSSEGSRGDRSGAPRGDRGKSNNAKPWEKRKNRRDSKPSDK